MLAPPPTTGNPGSATAPSNDIRPPPLDIRSYHTPPALAPGPPPPHDIWWLSIETCSNLFIWGSFRFIFYLSILHDYWYLNIWIVVNTNILVFSKWRDFRPIRRIRRIGQNHPCMNRIQLVSLNENYEKTGLLFGHQTSWHLGIKAKTVWLGNLCFFSLPETSQYVSFRTDRFWMNYCVELFVPFVASELFAVCTNVIDLTYLPMLHTWTDASILSYYRP